MSLHTFKQCFSFWAWMVFLSFASSKFIPNVANSIFFIFMCIQYSCVYVTFYLFIIKKSQKFHCQFLYSSFSYVLHLLFPSFFLFLPPFLPSCPHALFLCFHLSSNSQKTPSLGSQRHKQMLLNTMRAMKEGREVYSKGC